MSICKNVGQKIPYTKQVLRESKNVQFQQLVCQDNLNLSHDRQLEMPDNVKQYCNQCIRKGHPQMLETIPRC